MDSQTTVLFNPNNVSVPITAYPLENCEVARVENPISANKPTITFKRSQIYVNKEFIKCAPEMLYVLFLMDRAAKNLILRPCDKLEQEAVRLRTLSETNPKPRHITGDDFNLRLFEFMHWDKCFRYKVAGNLINSNNEILAVFNLDSAVRFELPATSNSPSKSSDTHFETGVGFGTTVREYIENPIVEKFTEDISVPIGVQNSTAERLNSSDTTKDENPDPSLSEVKAQ